MIHKTVSPFSLFQEETLCLILHLSLAKFLSQPLISWQCEPCNLRLLTFVWSSLLIRSLKEQSKFEPFYMYFPPLLMTQSLSHEKAICFCSVLKLTGLPLCYVMFWASRDSCLISSFFIKFSIIFLHLSLIVCLFWIQATLFVHHPVQHMSHVFLGTWTVTDIHGITAPF